MNYAVDFIELHSNWNAARHSDFESRKSNFVAGRRRLAYTIKGDKFVSSASIDRPNDRVMNTGMTGDEQQVAIVPKNHSRKATVGAIRYQVSMDPLAK